MKVFLKTTFLLLFVSFLSNATQGNKEETINNLVKEGQKHSYNFELEKASKIFDTIIKHYPEDPRGYYYKSTIYLWSYLGNSEKKNFDGFVNYSSTTIDKAKDALKKDEDNETFTYILGSIYGYRAIAFGKADKFLDMIWASQKSNSYLNDAIKINPNNYDAYMGIGLFKFALSQVPSSFKWALNLIGFDADQVKGLRYLTLTAEKGEFSRIEAEYYLAHIYSEFFMDFEKSSSILKSLIKKYPSNVLFLYSLAVVDIKQRDLGNAEKVLQKLVKQKNPEFKQIISLSNFLLGDVYFRKNEFEKAINYYNIFTGTSGDKDYKGIANYRCALCYVMIDNIDTAKDLFSAARNGNLNLDDDLYAKRKAELFLKNGITDTEKSIIRFSNMIETGSYKKAADSLSTLLEMNENNEFTPKISLYLAEALFELNQYDESLKHCTIIFANSSKVDEWILPFTHFIAASNYYELKNISKAKENIEKAEKYSDYDYQNKLQGKINNFKSRMNS